MKWHHFRVSSQLLKEVCDSVCHRIIKVKSCTDTIFARKDFFKTAALIDTGFKFFYYLVRRNQFLSFWNIVDQNRVAHHAVRSASTLHLHREPCSEQQDQFLACPTLPPPQLSPREPPINDHNWVAHHAVRSASTLHLHREPCSEQ